MKRFLLLFTVIACSYINVLAQKNVNASFTVDTSYGCAPVTVKFTNTSTGNVNYYYWEFGDGTVSSEPSPEHVYSKPGKYNAKLIVYNDAWEFDTAYAADVSGSIYSLPFSSMAAARTFCGQPVQLTTGLDDSKFNSLTSFLWSTGATSPGITVSQPGQYVVILNGCGQSIRDTVEVLDASDGISLSLNGDIHWSGEMALVKFKYQVPFDERVTSGLQINYGDGVIADYQPRVDSHWYAHPGSYQAMLTATMLPGVNEHCDTSAYLNFNIREPYLKASSWNYRDTLLLTGQTLVLHAGTPDASCVWKRSDGFILSTDSVLTIETEGYYELTMTKNGDERTDYITVRSKQPVLTAYFSAEPDLCGLTNFTDRSAAYDYPIVKRTWYFGDGTVDNTSMNPVHQYATGGYYIAKLVVENSNGIIDSTSQNISIPEYPAIRLPGDTTIRKGSVLYLTDLNSNTYEYTWSTGEKGYGIEVSLPGLYYVTGKTHCASIIRTDSIYVTVKDDEEDVTEVIIPDSTITGTDSLTVNASFAQDFNSDNVFTVQLTLKDPAGRTTGLQPEEVINLRSMPGTSGDVSMSVGLNDTLACATSYAVRVVGSSPADTTAWSQQFTVKNQPPQPVITQRGDSLFTSGKYNWQWYFNEAPVEGATAATYRARANGAYRVESLNGNGCSSKSAPLSVVITAIDDVVLNGNKVKAYPNPSEGEVYLQFEKPLLKAVTIQVYGLDGRVVYTRTTMQQLQPLDLSNLPGGFYLIELTVNGKKKTLSLILQ